MNLPGFQGNDRWRSILDLYRAASELAPEDRIAFLASAQCDKHVTEEVLALLNDLDQSDDAADTISPSSPDLKLRTGSSRYILLDSLGKGGTGQVYSARDLELDRIVALKFLDPEKLDGLSASQLVREARAASALNHPNIVTVHEVIESHTTLAIVMEFVEGSVLRTLIGRRPVPIPDLARIGHQIAQALAAAHHSGIIHRDIKPENIIARPDGFIKLLDFGLARRIDAVHTTVADLPIGTLPYMSPEQARGDALRPATDIFSLGIVLHELATGRHPFPAASPFGIVDAILAGAPSLYDTVRAPLHPKLKVLLLAMLDQQPQNRPTAQQVANRLDAIAADQSFHPLALAAAATVFSGTPARILAVTCVLVALLSLGIWSVAQRKSAPRIATLRQVTTQVPENRVTAAAISPDGKRLVFACVDGVFVREFQSNATYPLASPSDFLIDKLRWLKDGSHLLAGGFSPRTQHPAIWSISLLHDPPRLLKTDARDPEPSPDGTRIAFTDATRSAIWTSDLKGEQQRRVYGPKANDRYSVLLWTRDGSALRFQRRPANPPYGAIVFGPWDGLGDESVTEHHYMSVALRSGKTVADLPNISMTAGFGVPDGRIFYLGLNRKAPAEGFELWELATDPNTGRALASPTRISQTGWFSDLTATANGQKIVMLRSFNARVIKIGDYSPVGPSISNVRPLTLDASSNFPHSWTPDSRAVNFESNRAGTYDLYKQQVTSRTAESIFVSPENDVMPIYDNAGDWLLFQQGYQSNKAVARLMRVRPDGTSLAPVPLDVRLDEFACALHASRCVLRQTEGQQFYVFYDLDPIRGRGAELARTRWSRGIFGDWAVSPDGREIAMPVHDSFETRIRLISLGTQQQRREQELAVSGFSDLNGLNWTADGNGLFAVFNTSIGWQLTHIDRRGQVTPLLEAVFALPSPDGRMVAMMIESAATNAWLVENF